MGFAKFPSPDLSIAVILFLEIFFFLMALASRRAPTSLDGEPEEVQDCRSHAGEAGDSSELPFVIGDEGIAERKGPGPRSAGRCRQVVTCLSRRTRSIPQVASAGIQKSKTSSAPSTA